MAKKKSKKNYMQMALVGFWLANSAVFYATGNIWQDLVVVGNSILSPIAAALTSGFLLAGLVWVVDSVLKTIGLKIKDKYTTIFLYLGVNTVGIWGLGRMAEFTGVGLAVFWIAILLGIIITLLQWAVWEIVERL